MVKELNGWYVVESIPISGLEPRILAMVAPREGIIRVAVVDSKGMTSEITLDYERMYDFIGAMYQAWKRADEIKRLEEKLESEGLCRHSWANGDCNECIEEGK